MKRPWIPAIIVGVLLVVYRICTANSDLVNFSPIVAIFFLAGSFWRTNKWLLPTAVVAWIISGPLTSMLHGHSAFSLQTVYTLIALAITVGIGFTFQKKTAGKLILGTLAAAVAFYFITNTISFFTSPLYAKTLEGYVQSMWTGPVASKIPTYVFFRNSLIANGVFTSLFIAVLNIAAIKKAIGYKPVTA